MRASGKVQFCNLVIKQLVIELNIYTVLFSFAAIIGSRAPVNYLNSGPDLTRKQRTAS